MDHREMQDLIADAVIDALRSSGCHVFASDAELWAWVRERAWPEGAAYIHDGEDGSAPLIHVCHFGDSVTVARGPTALHVRFDHAEQEATDD